MYEEYSRQSLPSKEYRELLGSALCVFNSNNSFIIENILKNDENNEYSWYKLIDLESGKLKPIIKKTISKNFSDNILEKFELIVKKRNRIIHSFQITHKEEQISATKDRENKQSIITQEILLNFIKDNEELNDMLHDCRGY